MTQEITKLERIIRTRMKFMSRPWATFEVEVLKTLARITFYSEPYSKGGRDGIRDSRRTEYSLTPNFTLDNVVEDQQRKLGRDIISFVGKENMDELLEVLV